MSTLQIFTNTTKNELNPFILTLTYFDNCWTLLATRNAQSLTPPKGHPFSFLLQHKDQLIQI
jgi:hypothetical protein